MKKKSNKLFFFIFLMIVFILVVYFLIFRFKPLPLLNGRLNWQLLKQDKNQEEEKELESFVFAVAGDNHNNIEVYEKLIQKVNESKAVFFVDLGDSTRVGGASEYLELKNMLDKLKVPYHMVIGDHDIVGNGLEIWQRYFGATYYSWDFQNVHFVALNDVDNENGFSDEQLAWLEQDLFQTKKEVKIVFLHRPPRCPFTEPGDLGFKGSKSDEQINKFLSVLEKYQVRKIYSGHIHNFLNYSISGIPITVTGGAGGPIYKIPLIGKDFHHYIEVNISGSNLQQKIIEL